MSSVIVKINGIEYNLKGQEDEKYMKSVAEYVNTKIMELLDKNPKLNQPSATVLAAINISDELYKSDMEYEVLAEKYKRIKKENEQLKNEILELNQSKDILEELKKEAERQKLEGQEIEKEYKELRDKNKVLFNRNKEISQQLHNYKYKVLDLEKKYMDIQFKLASEKGKDNLLLKNKNKLK
ncbi:cell division protein ZapA [Clostridium sp. YIM B02551]|uniref:cell division protein ZapA n=1 Tax=Clostridium sp. YIM B02551 TaxID=2910679 RepID=UPI001EECDC1F|nr:cell division protein ZapA [Clostridium sp. YIM B02551]